LKKNCSHSQRGFFGFGEALAKLATFHVGAGLKNPVTEPKRSQNQKRPLFSLSLRMASVFLKML